MKTSSRALAALFTAFALCGCSSSSSPNGNGNGNGSPDGGGAATATCSQLVAADVQGLMTNPVAGMDVSPLGVDSDGQQCIFHDADSEQAIDVIVAPSSDAVAGYAAAKGTAVNPIDVSGVGDEAFREKGDFVITADHGGVTCAVSTASAVQIPGVDKLVVNGTLNLTEPQNAILAAALGTVCNRLYGVGNITPNLGGL